MPGDYTDRYEVSVEELKPLQDKVSDEYGTVEYLIAFNATGQIRLFTREGNVVQHSQQKDEVFKAINEALVGNAKDDYNYIRVRKGQHGDVFRHTVENPYCCAGGIPCPQHIISIPFKYRLEKEKIDIALAKHSLAPDQLAEVKKLRADGETLQKEGEQAKSLKKLDQAKAILGIR